MGAKDEKWKEEMDWFSLYSSFDQNMAVNLSPVVQLWFHLSLKIVVYFSC